MSQVLSPEDLLQLKQAIMEELELLNNQVQGDELQQLLLGFASKRGDFSIFEEQLIRKIITGNENGKLPSESLREKIIKNNYIVNNVNIQEDLVRNSKGSIFYDKAKTTPIFLTVDSANLRFKKSKIKYTFDINFSEFIINPNNTQELIDQLKDQIETLKNQLAVNETDKETLKSTLKAIELDNQDLKFLIEDLQTSIADATLNMQELEQSTQEQITSIQKQAQDLILTANTKLAEKESEYINFKNKVELIFTVSKTYEDILENFKKIGIGQ